MARQTEQRDEELLQKIPSQPPRHSELFPGISYRSFLKARLAKVIMPLLIGGVFLGWLMHEYRPYLYLNMRTAQGTVVEMSPFLDRGTLKKSGRYVFDVPGGKTFSGGFRASVKSSYFFLSVGDTIAIRYAVSDPTFNRAGRRYAISDLMFNHAGRLCIIVIGFVLFGAIAMLVAFVVILWFSTEVFLPLQRYALARKVFKEGIMTRGILLYIQVGPRRSSLPNLLTVEYTTDSGLYVESTIPCERDRELSHLTLGMPLKIIYLPEKPKQCIALESYARWPGMTGT